MWILGFLTLGCGKHAPTSSEESAAVVPIETQLQTEGKEVLQAFASELKPQLVMAMQSGGPVKAVEVCAQKAPQIAQTVSQQTGWDVKRVSLKNRNESAVPDEWERLILETFEKAQAEGSSADDLVASMIVDNEFRMMKAQVVQPLCLTCHGSNIDPNTAVILNTHYPNDLATGYTEGQVRGAISIRKNLDSALKK